MLKSNIYVYLFIAVFLCAGTLTAQELPTDLFSAEQLELIKKSGEPVEFSSDKKQTLPVAKSTAQKNTNDLEPEQKIKILETSNELSTVEYYYDILTEQKLDIFGYTNFSTKGKNDNLFYNTLQDNYQLAPGDVVQITTRGLTVIEKSVQVDSLGHIALPDMNPFFAQGKTLKTIEQQILQELKIDDASASVYVSLNAARLIPVMVTGAVKTPQTIAVPAYTPVSQILSRAGGISTLGSLRNITVINNNKNRLNLDLYNILRDTNNYDEPLITTTSRIHVNDIGSTVAVAGFVGRPGIFELPPGEHKISVATLLELANSKLTPFGLTLELLTFDSNGVPNSTRLSSTDNRYVRNGEALRLSFAEARNIKEVSVGGEVLNPFKIIISSNGTSLKSILKKGAVLTQQALTRIAIVTSNNKDRKTVKALNLKNIFNGDDFLIFPGDIIEILNEERHISLLEDNSDISYQNISEIYLDEVRVAFIPINQQNDLKTAILSQIMLNQEINKDFAILLHKNNTSISSIKAFNLGQLLNSKIKINISDNSRISLFTNEYLNNLLLDINEVIVENLNLRSIKEVNPVEIFVDGERIGVLPPDSILENTELGRSLKINKNLYPLFVRETNSPSKNSARITYRSISLIELFATINSKLKAGKRIDVFSKGFITNLFTKNEEKNASIINLSPSSSEEIYSLVGEDDVEQNKGIDANAAANEKTEFTLYALKRASKRISGAVENPGLYPVAGTITLKTLIDVAGGILPGGNKSKVTLRKYTTNVEGITDISEILIIDITSVDPAKIILSGNYDVLIPNFVNDAAVGTATLSGEVMRPGEYTISRDETLEELISRAGGLTAVAYPLGLILNRETLKEQERKVNLALAQKLEQAILSAPQDSSTDVAAQMKATLFYANRLRSLPANGRLTVNYTGSSSSNGTMLEKDDEIIVPKRPSHVGITGNVQNPLMARYEKNKKIDDYISDAGGFDRTADIKNIYVVLPNGKGFPSDQLNKYGGIIPPGATIVVPPKTDKLSLLGLTEIFSRVLGNIATSLLAINAVSK